VAVSFDSLRYRRRDSSVVLYAFDPIELNGASETRERRFALECVVVDAVPIEPVSNPRFPDNREICRQFCKFGPLPPISVPSWQAASKVCS